MAVQARAEVDLLLLGAVGQEPPADGFALRARVQEQTRGAVAVSEQMTFRTLHRLTRNRLVRRLPDRTYRLTEVGERALETRRQRWERTCRAIGAVLGGVPTPGRPEESDDTARTPARVAAPSAGQSRPHG